MVVSIEQLQSTSDRVISDTGAVVGLENVFYMVSERVGVVEVCAIVYEPASGCPISFPFNVSLYTLDGTAGTTIYT